MRLDGKVALVTGATYGIGTTILERLAEEGAAVAFTGRSADKGRALEARLRAEGRAVKFAQGSVAEERDVEAAVASAVDEFGKLTTVVTLYQASKGAVNALTRQLAVDYGLFGIRSNAIVVGFTPTGGEVITKMVENEAFISAVKRAIPSPRLGSPLGIPDTSALSAIAES